MLQQKDFGLLLKYCPRNQGKYRHYRAVAGVLLPYFHKQSLIVKMALAGKVWMYLTWQLRLCNTCYEYLIYCCIAQGFKGSTGTIAVTVILANVNN
jgi:hypothetical protein